MAAKGTLGRRKTYAGWARLDLTWAPEKPTLSAYKPAGCDSPGAVLQELMADPVMVATGHTYDRVCVERWLGQGNRTCPVTGMRLRHLELTPNFALRNAIQVCMAASFIGVSCHMPHVCIISQACASPGTPFYARLHTCFNQICAARLLMLGFHSAQEWAAHNGVPVPHKEGRVNSSLLYKGGEEDTPTNILQVCSVLVLSSGQLWDASDHRGHPARTLLQQHASVCVGCQRGC